MGNPSYEQTAYEQGFEGLGDNEDSLGISSSTDESEVLTPEEAVAQDEPQREDYETMADYEDAMEGHEYRLNQAREIEKDLTYKPAGFKMPSAEKLKKFSEATKGLKQEQQRGELSKGPAGYGGPGKRTFYVPKESPYQITERGLSTAELEKMLLEGLKTSANMRISGFQGPRIRGLFG